MTQPCTTQINQRQRRASNTQEHTHTQQHTTVMHSTKHATTHKNTNHTTTKVQSRITKPPKNTTTCNTTHTKHNNLTECPSIQKPGRSIKCSCEFKTYCQTLAEGLAACKSMSSFVVECPKKRITPEAFLSNCWLQPGGACVHV
jgi:electron transfer flavoprotein alpha subunit